MRFLCKENALTASIYIDLRRKVNFKEYRKEDVETAIANSLYSVVVFDDKRPIGIARLVGDGRIAFFIKDVVVDPAYQKNRLKSSDAEAVVISVAPPEGCLASVSCPHRTVFSS
ncbi:MAG: hypothetical protein ACLSWD_11480 [Clostridium sp.]